MSKVLAKHGSPRREWEMTSRHEVDSRALWPMSEWWETIVHRSVRARRGLYGWPGRREGCPDDCPLSDHRDHSGLSERLAFMAGALGAALVLPAPMAMSESPYYVSMNPKLGFLLWRAIRLRLNIGPRTENIARNIDSERHAFCDKSFARDRGAALRVLRSSQI